MSTKALKWSAVPVLLLTAGYIKADDETRPATPLKGAVSQGMVLANGQSPSTRGIIYVAPLQEGGIRSKSLFHGGVQSSPVRWHVRYGHFWPAASLSRLFMGQAEDRDCDAEELYRYRLDDLRAGKFKAVADQRPGKFIDVPGFEEGRTFNGFTLGGPLRDIHILDGHFEYLPQLHYDYLPVAEDRVLLFVLTDTRGHLESAGTGGELGGAHVVVSAEEAKTPKWSLTIHSCRNTWDADKNTWSNDPHWKREGTIEVGFTEGFNALGKGDDYYFLTVSGKLYRAPKPDKGADRKMEAVWDDEKRPVVAFITDADADRTFLFCKPDKDGKGVYFEMDTKPDPQPYDAGKIPEAKPDDALPAVIAYAKILVADKKIKNKE